jgi:hypothetical protein
MAAHKGPANLRPRCTRSGSYVAAIPVYTHQNSVRVVPPEDGQVMSEISRGFEF